ncbi:hypothetical protein C8J57DRAFT_1246469 [Mycena rebaudengoi]|nr:hypothetical protein C8J57DRAFT_1246469 [Mycena rebaudengoi]
MFSAGGIISYIACVGSAILDSDSPYQAPLGVALALLYKRHNKKISAVFTPIHQFVTQSLPLFLKLKSDTEDGITPLFSGSPPPPSPAVPVVLWVLETSTNPDLISAAAAMATELQWPQGRDQLWAGATIKLGSGQGDLPDRDYFLIKKDQELYLPAGTPESIQLAELRNVFETWKGSRECFRSARTQSSMDWVLRVLPYTIWDISEKDTYLQT